MGGGMMGMQQPQTTVIIEQNQPKYKSFPRLDDVIPLSK